MRRVRGGDTDAAGEAGLRLPGLRPRLPQAVPRPRRTALRRDLAAKHGTVSMNNASRPSSVSSPERLRESGRQIHATYRPRDKRTIVGLG